MKNSISIIHPSRMRPQMAISTAEKWLSSCTSENELEYIFSIDETDPTLEIYLGLITYLKTKYPVKYIIKNNQSCIDAANNGASSSKNNLIVLVSDDFDCFQGWDSWLMNHLTDRKDFIVKTSDGIQNWLITLPIMDREYYERFGYIYYPQYHHLFCDTEMTEVAHILGRVIDLQDPNYVFTHNHWVVGKGIYDEISDKNEKTWMQGESLFNERKQNNFYL